MAKDKCGNANPGSRLNAGCGQAKGHDGNHTNGFSEWTKAQGQNSGGGKGGK